MSLTKFRFCAAFAVGIMGFGISARAAFIIQLTQSGTNVIATGNGTLNLAALTSTGTTTNLGIIDPALGFVGDGSPAVSSFTFYSQLTGPISFGSGGSEVATTGSGSEVLIAGSYEEFAVPAGYISGTQLSDSATFSGTFASLGITPGTYTWNWGTGASADYLKVTTAPVPEPASLAAICVCPSILLLRRRRQTM